MKTENWKEVKKLLRDALQIKPSERRQFLVSVTSDGRLRAEVESLLALETEIDDFLTLPISDFSKDFLPEEDDAAENANALVGQQIGIYEILGELGGGGMGAVYLAKRTDGKFEQRVAVKMLRREFNNEKIRRHFRREKEIQAKLNHPNIARLLDAGTTGDGIPFLVMEFIEGIPVDKFCAAKNLSLKERLELFNRICEAVAAAHRNLIVHRDLKPSNILIDESGEPKLLDFGISKILDAEEAEESQTVTLLGAMTPEYASPEQIKGETVSTATDIYSLGVVLYKMLTGALPYNLKGKTGGELLKTISEDEPTAPSLVEEGAKRRRGEREKGRRREEETKKILSKISPSPALPFSPSQIKGDLDNIILKAINKEPERRYQTVEQFADDIRRHLDGLPVLARPATISYRAGKLLRRNKIALLAALLVLSSLLGGIAVALWQAREARAQANFALESQRRSNDEREKAEKISDFMSKIIAYGSPHWMSPGYKYQGETKVIEALHELSGQIDVEFADQPEIQAELHQKFADAFHFHVNEELLIRKRFHIDRVLELRRQMHGDYHEKVAEALFSKWSSLPTDDSRQAEILMEAINMMRGTNPNDSNLPFMYEGYTNRLAGMEELPLEKSVPHLMQKNVRVPSREEYRALYRAAVQPPTNENNFEIAERMLRESMPILRQRYEENSYPVVSAECNLSYVLAKQDRWADFDEHFRVCRRSENVPGNSLENYRKKVEVIEKISGGKNIRN